jgi:hypothetical protein
MNNTETIILIAVVILLVILILPSVCGNGNYNEGFTAIQDMDTGTNVGEMVPGINPFASNKEQVRPQPDSKNFESLIYDPITGTISSGSAFMDQSGLITPPWTAPAWSNGSFVGPSSKGYLDPEDYENDPRMLYNKCSLSCCSPQYPTPFLQNDSDPFVCDENGNNKYLASNYICTNNVGSSGCLCLSKRQADGLQTGWVDYYVDKKNLGY